MKRPGFHRLPFLPIAAVFACAASVCSSAQDGVVFGAAPPGEKWTITTRWDYRVHIDGRYSGHADRELREVYVRREEVPGGWRIEGDARMLGNTRKDGLPVAARLDGRESADFVLGRGGSVFGADDGYPRLRGFPTFPDGEVDEGDRWEAPVEILVTGPDGQRGVLRQIASYRYAGMSPYMGRDAHLIEVQWAVRHRGLDPALNAFLVGLEGSHRVSLMVDAETGAPLMARDLLMETWRWADSRVEEREGFALIFWDGVPPLETEAIIREFEDFFPGDVAEKPAAADTGGEEDRTGGGERNDDNGGLHDAGAGGLIFRGEESELDDSARDIVIQRTSRGLSVTLRNLHFQPDRAVILADDYPLLDDIAGILARIPDRTVLVRGHTADVGRPEAQYALSEQRAKHVADELGERGIDPRRLVYEGVGADEPMGSNDTEEGRILNRRVELLILED